MGATSSFSPSQTSTLNYPLDNTFLQLLCVSYVLFFSAVTEVSEIIHWITLSQVFCVSYVLFFFVTEMYFHQLYIYWLKQQRGLLFQERGQFASRSLKNNYIGTSTSIKLYLYENINYINLCVCVFVGGCVCVGVGCWLRN